jgi:hypothetical protein
MRSIPALTIWQPWASLIIIGAKPWEFRGWHAPKAHIGKRIGIHAGARPVKKAEVRALLAKLASPNAWETCLVPELAVPLLERAYRDPAILPLSSMLGTATLGTPISGTTAAERFGGPVNDSARNEHANWGWPLTEIQPFEPFVPARGAQGLWPWEEAAHG